MTPPFLAGQAAFREGKPLSDNPYPEGMEYGDKYPGAWANWRDGWNLARNMEKHRQMQKKD